MLRNSNVTPVTRYACVRCPRRWRMLAKGSPVLARRATVQCCTSKSTSEELLGLENASIAATAAELLERCGQAWPAWHRNGFRLLKADGTLVPQVPSPSQAALLLRALGKRALKVTPASHRAALLHRHRTVLGLLECMQLTSPRQDHVRSVATLSPSHSPSLSSPHQLHPSQPSQPSQPPQPPLSAAEVSGCIWVLGVLGGDLLYEEEMEALTGRLPGTHFNSLSQVADVCWALGTCRHWTPHLPLLEEQAVRLVEGRLGEGVSSVQVANIMWGLSVLGHVPLRLLGLLPGLTARWQEEAEAQQQHGDRREGQEGNALRGGGRPEGEKERERRGGKETGRTGSGGHDQGVVEGGGRGSGRKGGRGPSPSSLCTLAWCCAVVGQQESAACFSVLGLLGWQLASAEHQGEGGRAPAPLGVGQRQLMQLHQVALALGEVYWAWEGEGGMLEKRFPQEIFSALLGVLLVAAAEADRLVGRRDMQTVSACQADVASTLRSLSLPGEVQEEVQVLPGTLVDMAVPALRLAVEVDGPTHYTRNHVPQGGLHWGGGGGDKPSSGLESPGEGSEGWGSPSASSPTSPLRPAAAMEAAEMGTVQAPYETHAEQDAGGAPRRAPMGATLLKGRMLASAGWRLVQVDALEWEGLGGGRKGRRRWLEAAIRAAGVEELPAQEGQFEPV